MSSEGFGGGCNPPLRFLETFLQPKGAITHLFTTFWGIELVRESSGLLVGYMIIILPIKSIILQQPPFSENVLNKIPEEDEGLYTQVQNTK